MVCAAPWLKFVKMPATLTPRPICAGLVPPRLLVPAVADFSVWLRVSSNTVLDVL